MSEIFIAAAAAADVESILKWTHLHFGETARLRYEALLVQALTDISNRPDLPGSLARPEVRASVRTYHLHYSRRNVALRIGRVREPRHFVLYRTRGDGAVEIGRVLHDSMDLDRHLPDDYMS